MFRSLASLATALFLAAFASPSFAAAINGTVLSSNGRPLASAGVQVWKSSGPNGPWTLVATATPDPTGFYAVEQLAAGDYRLLAYDNGGEYATAFYGGADSFDTTPRITAGAATRRVDFTLVRGGKATGRVTDIFDRARAQLVVAAYNASGTRRGFTKTGADGAWSLLLPPGTFRIAVYDENEIPVWGMTFHPGVRSFAEAAPVGIAASETTGPIVLRVDLAAQVSGQLRTSDGRPLPGPAVYAYTPEGHLVASVLTDVEGRYRLALASGPYRLVAADPQQLWATSYYPSGRSFERSPSVALAAGEVRPGIDFALELAGSISGTIRSAGAPLPGLEVGAFNQDGSLHVSTRTGADGRYLLKVAPGQVRIAAWDPAIRWVTRFHPASPDFNSSTPLTALPGGALAAIDMELIEGGRVAGLIRDSITKLPIPGARISAWDMAGTPAGDGRSGPDGRYAFAAVPGDVRLVAFDPLMRYAAAYPARAGSFDGAAPVPVAAGRETAIDFELKRGVIVYGSVADPWGTPLSGIEVFALDAAGRRIAAATTAEGAFAMVLVPGRYHFVAVDPMRRFAPRHYPAASTFEAGSPVDIANGPNASIAMTFEAAAGRRRAARH